MELPRTGEAVAPFFGGAKVQGNPPPVKPWAKASGNDLPIARQRATICLQVLPLAADHPNTSKVRELLADLYLSHELLPVDIIMLDASVAKPGTDTPPDWPLSHSTLGADLIVHFGKLSLLWAATWIILQTGFHGGHWHAWVLVMGWVSVSLIGQISFVLRRWLITLPQRPLVLLNLVFTAELLSIVQSVRWLG